MISWIQRNFQKHFRAVFGVLLAVTIISFVMVIGAGPGLGRAGPKVAKRLFFNVDLEQAGVSSRVFGDASLSAQLQGAAGNLDGNQLQSYGLQRVAALTLADQLKLPAPTTQEVADYIKTLRAFAGPDGSFDASLYAAFRDSLRTSQRVSEVDVARVLNDDLRIAHVRTLLAGPGYVLPDEVRDQLVRARSTWTLAVATLDYAAYKPDVPAPEDALKRFYDDNTFRYVVPDRVGVDYVEFPGAAFLDQVHVTDAEVRAYYDENSSRFPAPPKKDSGDKGALKLDSTAPSNPDADFAAVRPQVELALRTERAQQLSAKAAADLTVEIYDQKLKPGAPDFAALLASHNLTLKTVPPFDRDTPPTNPAWSPQIVDQALRLSAQKLESDPLPTATGTVVLFWRETVPSYQATFAQARERVIADYKENERRKRFVDLGRTLRGLLETRVKAGDTFAKAAAAASVDPAQPKLDVKEYPPFTRQQPPADLNPAVQNVLDQIAPGQVSDMLIAQNKGYLVYVQDRKLPDLSETGAPYAVVRAQLAQLTAGFNQELYLNQLTAQELKKTEPASR
ncbi:MAG TPA: peptidyl-prolyl cis-trans isomerase [Opitutaceae bacterium]|nr:peptidyl-prolyl cis-trans isomerase [Opitutaceae bacterium]